MHIVDTSLLCGIEEEPFVMVEQVTQCCLHPLEENSSWAFAVPTTSRFATNEKADDQELLQHRNSSEEEGLAA